MRSLLVGAAGPVGQHLRQALADHDVIATFHSAPVQGGSHLDITDERATKEPIRSVRPDAVFLAAAEANVERCEREPATTRRVSVDPVRAIVEEADSANAIMIALSSDYVFDGTKGRYVEDDPVAPLNEYGRQKVELEGLVLSVPRNLVIRTSGVFGRDVSGKNFVLQFERTVRAGRPFAVPSDQLITPTYAPSLARAVVQLAERRATRLMHVAGPRILSRVEFAHMVCSAFGLATRSIVPTPTIELGLAAARPRRAGLADDRIRRLLGPLTDPEEALSEMSRGGFPHDR